MDLSKIGKCEICCLSKRVIEAKIALEKSSIKGGTWDQAKMDRYGECIAGLDGLRDMMHRFEQRPYLPMRTVEDVLKDPSSVRPASKAPELRQYYTTLILDSMKIAAWIPEEKETQSDP